MLQAARMLHLLHPGCDMHPAAWLQSGWLEIVSLVVIITNTAVMASQSYPGNPQWQVASDNLNVAFCFYFILELLVKLLGVGPGSFVRDKMNLFDALVVAASLVEVAMFLMPGVDSCKCGPHVQGCGAHGSDFGATACSACNKKVYRCWLTRLCHTARVAHTSLRAPDCCPDCRLGTAAANNSLSVLRTARLLRVFKLARSWAELNRIITTILKSFSQVMYLSLLLLLFVFVFALMVSWPAQASRVQCINVGSFGAFSETKLTTAAACVEAPLFCKLSKLLGVHCGLFNFSDVRPSFLCFPADLVAGNAAFWLQVCQVQRGWCSAAVPTRHATSRMWPVP
jgi:hypothetical protein